MTILILLLVAFFIFAIMKKYRNVYSVGAVILLLLGITSAVLIWGEIIFKNSDNLVFFNSKITKKEFFVLLLVWYAADIVSSVIIIRNYIEYRKINVISKKP